MLNPRFFFFLLMLLLNFDTKAFVMAVLPSSLSDTCMEINLKSGTRIIAKITKKTPEKVYFKKCDDTADSKEYFIAQEKIDNIKSIDIAVKDIQKEKKAERTERKQNEENKAKQTRIWLLLAGTLLALLLILGVLAQFGDFFGLSTALFLLLVTSSIWGLIEVLSYKGKFEGKGFALAYFVSLNILIFLFLLFLLLLILSFG